MGAPNGRLLAALILMGAAGATGGLTRGVEERNLGDFAGSGLRAVGTPLPRLCLRVSGGCGPTAEDDEPPSSESSAEYEGPKLPDAETGPPPPRSLLKVSEDGEVWVEKEGQEQLAEDVNAEGRERKVVETLDLGPDVACSCELCTGGTDGNGEPASCGRANGRRDAPAGGSGSGSGSGPAIPPRLTEELRKRLQAAREDLSRTERGDKSQGATSQMGTLGAEKGHGGGAHSSEDDVQLLHGAREDPGSGLESRSWHETDAAASGAPVEWEDEGGDGDCDIAWETPEDHVATGRNDGRLLGGAGGGRGSSHLRIEPDMMEELAHAAQAPGGDGVSEGRGGNAGVGFVSPPLRDSDLTWALRRGEDDAALEALAHGASRQDLNEELLEAAKEGDMERLRLTIRLGGDVDCYDSRGTGFSALHWAAIKGHDAAIRALIDAGAFVDQPGLVGATPLQLAVIHANPAAVEALLDAGANMHTLNDHQMSALMLAKSLKQGSESLPLLQGCA